MSPACLLGGYIPSTRRERGCSLGVSGGCACVCAQRQGSAGVAARDQWHCCAVLGALGQAPLRLDASVSSSVKEVLYLCPNVVVRVK